MDILIIIVIAVVAVSSFREWWRRRRLIREIQAEIAEIRQLIRRAGNETK